MKSVDSTFRKEKGRYLIEVRLRDLDQFFNSLDPSPFHDKDIDDDAERYIVNSVGAFPLKTQLKLVFYLPHEHHTEAATVLSEAIDNYFDFRVTMARRELGATLNEGRVAMVLGLAFLVTCITVRTALGALQVHLNGMLLHLGMVSYPGNLR